MQQLLSSTKKKDASCTIQSDSEIVESASVSIACAESKLLETCEGSVASVKDEFLRIRILQL